MHLRNLRRHSRGGFSLIELLLVLVILGTLAALVVPNLVGQGKEAKITATKSSMRTVEQALERYEMHCSAFPTTDDGLAGLMIAPADKESSWKGPYLKKVPKDAWGNEFQYRQPGEHEGTKEFFDLWSNGPDGKEGTEDDIVNWETDEGSK